MGQLVVMVMRPKGSRAPRVRQVFLIRPEAYSAGCSAGAAEKSWFLAWLQVIILDDRGSQATFYFFFFFILMLYLQRCIHLNIALESTTAWWGEYSTDRLLTVAVPFLPVGVKTTWPYDLSSVFVSAVCRVTWHDLDQFPPGQDRLGPAGSTTVLNAFGPGLSPVWSDVQ